MIASKIIYVQGAPQSGKTMLANILLRPMWEDRICIQIDTDHEERLEKALDDQKIYIHVENFPASPSHRLLTILESCLEKELVILITSQQAPPKEIHPHLMWVNTKPYPYS